MNALRSDLLTTSALARAAGVETSTIRFYERRNLLVADMRRPSGYRFFGLKAVGRVRFIREAQGLGFTLEEIAGLLELEDSSGAADPERRSRIEREVRGIEDRIGRLVAIRQALKARLTSDVEAAEPASLVETLQRSEFGGV